MVEELVSRISVFAVRCSRVQTALKRHVPMIVPDLGIVWEVCVCAKRVTRVTIVHRNHFGP